NTGVKRLPVAISLEVEEEECLVLPVVQFWDIHRPAHRSAVVCQVLHNLYVVPRAVISERNASVQDRILHVVVHASVKLVRPALGCEVVDATAADAAELGGEIRR